MNNTGLEQNGRFEKMIFFSYLALLVWMPLPLASNRAWAWSIAEVWILLLCAGLCLTYLRGKLSSNDVLLKAKPVLWLFACWLALLLFQLVPLPPALVEVLSPVRFTSHNTINPHGEWLTLTESVSETLVYLLKSLVYVLLFIMTILLVNSRRRVKLLAWTIVYSALFQAMYGSLMTLSGLEYGFFIKKFAYIDVATGTFVNRNHLAGYLNMGLAIGVGLLIAGLAKGNSPRSARHWYRKVAQLLLSRKAQLRIYIALMTVALVLTHSRMGNMAFFVALSVIALLSLILTRHARRTMAVLVVSIIVIDIFILSAWFGLEKVASRMQQTSLQTEKRDEVALNTLEQWQDYFVLGAGGGTYQYVFPKYRDADIRLYYDHAHNDVLEIASETGVIGISLLVGAVLLSFFTALRALSQRHDPLMIGMAFAAAMGMLALSIHSFVDFNLQIPANAATFMVLLALGWIARFHVKH